MRPLADAVPGFIFFTVPVAGAELPLIVVWLICAGVFRTFYLRLVNIRGFKLFFLTFVMLGSSIQLGALVDLPDALAFVVAIPNLLGL